MAELRTEEEQLDALKNWWKENGKALMLGIGAAVVIVVGWQGWQSRQATNAAQASMLYQSLIESVVVDLDEGRAQTSETLQHLGARLKAEHAKTTYAQYAALILARAAVQSNNNEAALAELDWVIANSKEEDIKRIATLRKAKILLGEQKAGEALSLMDSIDPASFSIIYHELRGDAYFLQNNIEAARREYDRALAANTGEARPILQMKRDDLGSGGGS